MEFIEKFLESIAENLTYIGTIWDCSSTLDICVILCMFLLVMQSLSSGLFFWIKFSIQKITALKA